MVVDGVEGRGPQLGQVQVHLTRLHVIHNLGKKTKSTERKKIELANILYAGQGITFKIKLSTYMSC